MNKAKMKEKTKEYEKTEPRDFLGERFTGVTLGKLEERMQVPWLD